MRRLIPMPVLFAGLIVAGCAILQKPPADPRTQAHELEEAHKLYERGGYPHTIYAFRAFERLANQGVANAQFTLGYMYENGEAVSRDYAEAAQWYRRAADQGLAEAQNNLGRMYAEGRGVRQDDLQAAAWYRKAADQGLGEAQYSLGLRYYRGSGVPQDDVLAHMWASLAMANSTGRTYGFAARLRDTIASRMTPKEISQAQRLARKRKPGMGAGLRGRFPDLEAEETPAPSKEPPKFVAPARAHADIERRLRSLKKLYDQGLITESDYADKRKQLLKDL